MASILLHNTIKDLHGLLQANTGHQHFDVLLRRTLHNLFVLLELSKHPYQLHISTTCFNPLLLVFYTNNTVAPLVDINNENIYGYLKDDTSVRSDSSVFDQLLHLLADSHQKRRPVRLKQSYSELISRFSNLVQFFLKLHRDTESELVDLIFRSFSYEHAYFASLRSQLDHPSNDDTQNMVLALDSFIRKMPDDVSDADSLFSYGHEDISEQQLDFECLDEPFSKLYRTFLQLALQKSLDTFYHDALAYAKVMVKMFKISRGVDFFEPDAEDLNELKFQHICDFYLGDGGLMPPEFLTRARSIIEEMFTLRIQSESIFHTLAETPMFQKDELVELLSNLDVVVSILNEYGLEFQLSFPTTFQTYIHLVYEVFPDITEHDDIEYIGNIDTIVGEIIDFENPQHSEGDIIRDIVSQLYNMQSRLLTSVDELTLLMRAARKDVEVRYELVHRVFQRWNHKLLIVSQLDLIYDEKFNTKREKKLRKKMLSIWFNKTIRYERVWLQAATYSDKKLMANVLSSYWLTKVISIAKSNELANVRSIKPFFDLWKGKQALIAKKMDHFLNISLQRSREQVFSMWMLKFQKVQALEESCQLFLEERTAEKNARLVEHLFKLFKDKFEACSKHNRRSNIELSQKLPALGRLEFQFTAGKYLKLWYHRYGLTKGSNKFRAIRNKNCKEKVLQEWKRQFKLRNSGRLQEENSAKLLLASLFHHWKFMKGSRMRADSYYAASLLRRVIRNWKLRLVESDTNDMIRRHELTKAFRLWRLGMHLGDISQPKNRQLALRTIRIWREKSQIIATDNENAFEFNNIKLIKRIFQIWCAKYDLELELTAIADLNFQRKYLNKISRLYLTNIKQNERANEFRGKLLFEKQITLQAVVRTWNSKYLEMFDNYSLKSIEKFQRTITAPGTLGVFFHHWRNKKAHNDMTKRQLEINYLHFVESSPSKRALFSHWNSRIHNVWDNQEAGEQFNMTLLRKKFLVIWYERHVTKVGYLNDVAQNMIDQKDYLRLVDYLRRWNLKYIKNIKRNQQTCDMFAEKWERAHLRSMFEIWMHKTHSRSSPQNYIDANSTIGSNSSPLAKKNPKLPVGTSILDGESYLSTPVKKQVSPSTPFSRNKGPSPTRLQETNQRMKVDRMDALISRYRLAKKESSKSRLRATELTKLSPPHSKVPIPVKPPAPLFDVGSRSMSPRATSSPSSSPKGTSPNLVTVPTSISDTSILATAKKLHRIKPLVVPPEEEDLQFSARKLRLSRRPPLGTDVFSI